MKEENKTAPENQEQSKVKSVIRTVLNCLLIISILLNVVFLLKRKSIDNQLQIQIEKNKLSIQKVNFIYDQLEKELINLHKKGFLE